MRDKRIAAFAVICGLISGPAWSQSAPPPSSQTGAAERTVVPTFRVEVVGRTARAINFRPRNGETKIDFVGTLLSPRAHGDATVKGKDGYIEIDADFDSLESPRKYGSEILTYVLWAITPEGRASNLGELQVSGDDGELRVTTELQAFGLIVTAEPYFAVTQPSDVVVMEIAPRPEGETIGRVELIEAKYDLLKRGTYLMNHDPSRMKIKPLEPGAPLDLAEARNAVEIARIAGAEQYATETFTKASRLLAEAELARELRRRGPETQQPARQAVQTAEDARLIAVKRIDEESQARQRAMLQQREETARRAELEARAQAQAEEHRRRQADADRVSAETARAEAERAKLEAVAAASRLSEERRAAEAARVAAEQARTAAELQAAQARAAAAEADREKAELRERLREQLDSVLQTRETTRGLIVNLPDVLFDFDSADLQAGAREKLARVSGILQTQPGLAVSVEGHTDSVGSDAYNLRLSDARARTVRDHLVGHGVGSGVTTAGFGEGQPVASNSTAAGRQQNRRVELVVTGEVIGRTSTTTTTTTRTIPAP